MFEEGTEMEIVIVVEREELSKLFLASAEDNEKRAGMYRAQASRVAAPVEEDEEEEPELAVSYGNTVARNIEATKQSYLGKAREHEAMAARKRFVAAHLPEKSTFPASQLQHWHLLEQAVR